MWIIEKIEEADSYEEEVLPGESRLLLLTLISEEGEELTVEVSENWLKSQGLTEGEEWPEDLDGEAEENISAVKQSEWMENYYQALEELEEAD